MYYYYYLLLLLLHYYYYCYYLINTYTNSTCYYYFTTSTSTSLLPPLQLPLLHLHRSTYVATYILELEYFTFDELLSTTTTRLLLLLLAIGNIPQYLPVSYFIRLSATCIFDTAVAASALMYPLMSITNSNHFHLQSFR